MDELRNSINSHVLWLAIHRYVQFYGGRLEMTREPPEESKVREHAALVAEINAAVAAIADAAAARVAGEATCWNCGHACTPGRVQFKDGRTFCSVACSVPYAGGI